MELRTCEFCGTEYNKDQQQCPLCGKSVEHKAAAAPEQKAAQPKRRLASTGGGARVAPKGKKARAEAAHAQQEQTPKAVWIILCVVLGIAVVAGALYFVYIMGGFDRKQEVQQEQQDLPEYNYENEQPAQEEQPAESEEEKPEEELPEDPNVVACTGLALSQTAVPLDEAGGRIFLTAVASPRDCTQEIEFFSTDESVVTVDQNGMITAVGPGEAEILVTCGDMIESCVVTCDFGTEEPEEEEPQEEEPEEEEPQGPAEDGSDAKLSSEDFTLFSPGEQTTLTVTNAPAGAAITYVSSDSSVATVTSSGLVTAVGSGTATITVTVNDTKLTCICRCSLDGSTENNGGAAYTGPFTLVNEYGVEGDCTLVRSGETCTIYLKDANGETVTGLSWSTSNSGVCTVDASGKVTAVGGGTATVSTVYNGETYTFTIRCSF